MSPRIHSAGHIKLDYSKAALVITSRAAFCFSFIIELLSERR